MPKRVRTKKWFDGFAIFRGKSRTIYQPRKNVNPSFVMPPLIEYSEGKKSQKKSRRLNIRRRK